GGNMGKQPESKLSTKIMKAWKARGAFCFKPEAFSQLFNDWEANKKIKELPNGCIEWQGATRSNGYVVASKGSVHRLVYEICYGEQDGLLIDHTCHDPNSCKLSKDCPHRRCVNPHHMKAGRDADNLAPHRRNNYNASKTHCPKGHEYSPENTYVGT